MICELCACVCESVRVTKHDTMRDDDDEYFQTHRWNASKILNEIWNYEMVQGVKSRRYGNDYFGACV